MVLVNKEEKILIYQNGKEINNFTPYKAFKGQVSLAVGDVNNDGQKEIITGTGPGGGPHVKVFSLNGQMLNEFMAYDENFRNGIIVMADDIDEDNKDEILIGAINF